MKLFRSCSLALVLAFTAGTALADTKPAGSGSGSGSASGAALTDEDKAGIAKFLAFFDSFVDTVVKDKDNCTTMAADINTLVDKNQDVIKKAGEAVAAGKQLDDASKQHMMASVKRLTPAMSKCGPDKGVQAAMMRMAPGKAAPKGAK